MEERSAWAAAKETIELPQRYGFSYEYTYDKGSDSSCVYVHRFKKGRDKFEIRVLSGAETIFVAAFVNGEYQFPNLKKKYAKLWKKSKRGAFACLRKRTEKETWDFYAAAIGEELKNGAIFGISVKVGDPAFSEAEV